MTDPTDQQATQRLGPLAGIKVLEIAAIETRQAQGWLPELGADTAARPGALPAP